MQKAVGMTSILSLSISLLVVGPHAIAGGDGGGYASAAKGVSVSPRDISQLPTARRPITSPPPKVEAVNLKTADPSKPAPTPISPSIPSFTETQLARIAEEKKKKALQNQKCETPEDFMFLEHAMKVAPDKKDLGTIHQNLVYGTSTNDDEYKKAKALGHNYNVFATDKPVAGYSKDVVKNGCVLQRDATQALLKAQRHVYSNSGKKTCLKVLDCYRPEKASLALYNSDVANKLENKNKYVAKRSQHNLGVAVDLTLSDCKTGKSLDMGTFFDDFSSKSKMGTQDHDLTDVQKANRKLLLEAMSSTKKFCNYNAEFWDYTFSNDPKNCEPDKRRALTTHNKKTYKSHDFSLQQPQVCRERLAAYEKLNGAPVTRASSNAANAAAARR